MENSVNEIIEQLTTEEKISLLRGGVPEEGGVTGYLPSVDRVEVPELRLSDGPLGVRSGEATVFPASIGLAATFDTDLAERFGRAIGSEARAKEFDVLLLPGCNLIRVPQCGRNYEYYSEDPCLAADITSSTVRGVQAEDVVATPKHYVANNQEVYRTTGSSEVGERTLREIYLQPWEAAVKEGDAGAIMASYNMVNGTYACQHEYLLDDVLKEEFGFKGPVMSDWWGVHDGLAAANGGLDLEMPGVRMLDLAAAEMDGLAYLQRLQEHWPDGIPIPGPADLLNAIFVGQDTEGGFPASDDESLFAESLPDALERDEFSVERLDDMVRRVLTLHERVGALGGHRAVSDTIPFDNREIAKELAVRGVVLLKNEDVLPLPSDASVVVIGPNADEAKLGGGGESMAEPPVTMSPLEGIRNRAEGRVVFERGHPPIENPDFFDFGLSSFIPDFGSDSRPEDAVDPVESADVAVVVVQDIATEGKDRESLALPGDQDVLIQRVAEAADETVVVLQTSGPVEMPWHEEVDAILEVWYPGQEGGDALAQVLYGDADPSGRLPVTFGSAAGDYPASSKERYPGVEGVGGYPEVQYEEGVFVGYRHFDERDIEPLFPFGHGLSYAEFDYCDPEVKGQEPPLTVTVRVENTSERKGREVVQVYVGEVDPDVERPPRELAGFESIELGPGEKKTVEIELEERAFAYYDEDHGWTVGGGEYMIEAGRSSRAIQISERVSLQK